MVGVVGESVVFEVGERLVVRGWGGAWLEVRKDVAEAVWRDGEREVRLEPGLRLGVWDDRAVWAGPEEEEEDRSDAGKAWAEGTSTWREGSAFVWEGWTLVRPVGDNDGYLWRGSGPVPEVAVELTGDSNGWWRWWERGSSYALFTGGDPSEQEFATLPWEDAWSPAALGAEVLTLHGGYGGTVVRPCGEVLRITLSNGRRLLLAARSEDMRFLSEDGLPWYEHRHVYGVRG